MRIVLLFGGLFVSRLNAKSFSFLLAEHLLDKREVTLGFLYKISYLLLSYMTVSELSDFKLNRILN